MMAKIINSYILSYLKYILYKSFLCMPFWHGSRHGYSIGFF